MSDYPELLITAPRALLRAQTVGDFLTLPFPLPVAPLQNPQALRRAYISLGNRQCVESWFDARSNLVSYVPNPCHGDSLEAHSLVARHLNQIHDSWVANSSLKLSGLLRHGWGLHSDLSEDPHGLLHVIPTFTPTMVVPDQSTFQIISSLSTLSSILKTKLTDPWGRNVYRNFFNLMDLASRDPDKARTQSSTQHVECSVRLHEALMPVSLDTISCMSMATLHKQGAPLHPKRVFLDITTRFTGLSPA